jgi:hypothetical protein
MRRFVSGVLPAATAAFAQTQGSLAGGVRTEDGEAVAQPPLALRGPTGVQQAVLGYPALRRAVRGGLRFRTGDRP